MKEEIKHITLRQGLEKFYAVYDSQLSHTKIDLPEDIKTFFASHDIAHVLFGCNISLRGEGSVKIWTIFGTDLGFWNHLSAYKKAQAFDLSKNFGVIHVLTNLLPLLTNIPIIIIRAMKMNRPWPWSDFEAYLDISIENIRKEFNIQVLK